MNNDFAQQDEQTCFEWKELPSIPDPVGFAGSFAGESLPVPGRQ